MWYKNLTDRQRLVGAIALVTAAVGLTAGGYGGYKYVYVPWAARRKFGEGESFTSYLYDKQDRAKATEVQSVQ
ncbi:hypothetical protein QE152_g36540 [Popillia japonica]|uniref:Uncharacterized protein n=1 Tax=Popillia japonica TaxID=7064 RepID=A0AAW1IDC7_POPJA